METLFAEIKDDIVVNVIVVDSNINNGEEFCVKQYGGVWKQVDNTVPIGSTYDSINDVFIPPKVFDSWVLTESFTWEAPVKMPKDGDYIWNEKELTWEKIEEVSA